MSFLSQDFISKNDRHYAQSSVISHGFAFFTKSSQSKIMFNLVCDVWLSLDCIVANVNYNSILPLRCKMKKGDRFVEVGYRPCLNALYMLEDYFEKRN